jgi:predicted Zn-dependent protease
MGRYFTFIWIFLLVAMLAGCRHVPITDRRQIALYRDKGLQREMFMAYRLDVIYGQLAVGTEWDEMVKQVGNDMVKVVQEVMTEEGVVQRLEHYEWEFNVLVKDFPGAYSVPGGKVMFYTGLMPICKDLNGVATVMGHEFGHIIANHYNEELSKESLTEVAIAIALLAATEGKVDEPLISGTVASLITGYFSYKQEMEADRIGLILMAKAGYDPDRAIDYYLRYDSLLEVDSPYIFDLGHPMDSLRRAEFIYTYIPEARKYYQADSLL